MALCNKKLGRNHQIRVSLGNWFNTLGTTAHDSEMITITQDLTTKSNGFWPPKARIYSNHQTNACHHQTLGFHHQHEAFNMAKSILTNMFLFVFHHWTSWLRLRHDESPILWPCWVVGKTQPAAGSAIEVNIRCCPTSNQTYAECLVGSRGYQLVCRSVYHNCNITRMILPSWWYIHITTSDASDQNSAMLKVTHINNTQQQLW